MERLEARVYGRVQGVMFRDFVERKAQSLSLLGYVYNEPEGTVCVVAEGEKASLEKLVTLLHKGPLLAHVEKVDVSFLPPTNAPHSFTILL